MLLGTATWSNLSLLYRVEEKSYTISSLTILTVSRSLFLFSMVDLATSFQPVILSAYLSSLVSCCPFIHKVLYNIIELKVDNQFTGTLRVLDSGTKLKNTNEITLNAKQPLYVFRLHQTNNKQLIYVPLSSQRRDWLNAMPLLTSDTLCLNQYCLVPKPFCE